MNINRKKLLFLGLSYKPGSYVTEESQALMIATLLASKSHKVDVHDPLAILSANLLLESGLTQTKSLHNLEAYDFIVLAVDWPEYEFVKSRVNDDRLIVIY